MKSLPASLKTVLFVVGALLLSYYILMARQSILLSTAIYSSQFWLMLVLGAICFYFYFRYSSFLNRKFSFSSNSSIFMFLILRLSLGVWIPSFFILFLLKELFSLLGIDFLASGYMDTEYFILMAILYSTTIGYIAKYFYDRYQQTQDSLNNIYANPAIIVNKEVSIPVVDEVSNEIEGLNLESDNQVSLKRELADMLLHVVLIRRRRKSILLFRNDGTCELFVNDQIVIDLFLQQETIMQINRWMWVNTFYVDEIKREDSEDWITLIEGLEQKFYNCKSFQEPHAQNQLENKSSLFIGRSYKKNIKSWFKNNRGNIDS